MKGYTITGRTSDLLFLALVASSILCVIGGIAMDSTVLIFAPAALLFLWFVLFDHRLLYFGMIFLIPFTKEFIFPGGMGLDLPAEPLVILLSLTLIVYLLNRYYEPLFFKNPVIQVLLIHVLWIAIAVLFAEKITIGFKWLLAKLWFVGTFVFVTGLFLRRLTDFKKFFWVIIIPASVAIIVVNIRHSTMQFGFTEINSACAIFFRNHVNYAAFVSLFIPFIWLAATWYRRGTMGSHLVVFLKILFLVATYFAYARGAWLGLIAAVIFYFALQHRLLKYVNLMILGGVLLAGIYLGTNKQFMDFAPNFEKAVAHENLGAHLKATLRNQDVSTAERVFRWVAGIRMSKEHPVTGFGPGGFYHYYKHYTLDAFRTYVSDNPERSGVHNYFLMTLIEQGFPGLIIFIIFTYVIFIEGAKAYHSAVDKRQRQFVMAIMCSIVVIYVQLMLSDLVEALQVGAFYLINIALLVNVRVAQQKAELAASEKTAGEQRDII